VPAAPLVQFPRVDVKNLIIELTDAPVVWDTEPLPLLGVRNAKAGYWIELSTIATTTKGWDEDRLTYDPVNQVNGATQISYRIYTVQIKVTSLSLQVPAFDVIDQIRRGLRSITAKDQYTELGIAFVDFESTRDLPAPADNRTTTVSTMDVRIAWQVATDPGDNDGNWIETVAKLDDEGVTP